jgi:Sigma-70, region 4
MPRLDELPPDLRATLSLLVDRGKTYTEVAELLGISEDAVRDRAHAALDQLAGAPAAPPYARPPGGSRSAAAGTASAGANAGAGRTPARGGVPGGPAVSRRGGAALLAAIVVVIVVVVVLVTSGGGGGSHGGGAASKSTASKGTTGASKSGSSKTPAVTNQLTLTAPNGASKAIGVVEVLAEGSQRAFYMAAEHLPPSTGFTYVVWLYNSPTSAEAVSKAKVGSNGRLQGGALLPSNASDYKQILLTRETSEHPAQPGPTVLSGAFSLEGASRGS